MRTEYLDKFLLTLPPYTRKHLEGIMADPDRRLSPEELDRMVAELAASYGRVIMKPRYQSDVISSSLYNETMKEIYMDLFRLFSECSKIGAAAYDHHRLNSSMLCDITRRLEVLEQKIDGFMAVVGRPSGYSIALPGDFRRSASEKGLYTLRSGEPVSEGFFCTIDPSSGELTLPVVSSVERTISPSGARLASIRIKQRPAGALTATDHSPEKAIDFSDSTFFGEVVLSDRLLEEDGFHGRFGFPVTGACLDFEIVFDSSVRVSEILLKPYTEHPLDLILVRAYETDLPDSPYTDIIASQDPPQVSFDSPIVLRFPRVRTKRIELALSQKHFTRNVYTIKKDEIARREFWEKVGAYELENPGMTYKDEDLALLEPGFSLYKHALEYWENELLRKKGLDPEEALGGALEATVPDPETARMIESASAVLSYRSPEKAPSSEPVKVAKYEYIYGFYDIKVRDRLYKDLGVWVSEPITVDSSIRSFRLSADFKHIYASIDGENVPATSLEWYIKTTNTWVPILPEEEPAIICEVLNLDSLGSAETRFPVEQLFWIRANGKRLSSGYSVSGSRVAIYEPEPDTIYTISYKPLGDPHTVDLLANPEPVFVIDSFPEVPKGRILELSRYPYIDLSLVNSSILQSGSFDPNGSYMPIKVSLTGDLSAIGCPINEVTMRTVPRAANTTDYTGQGMNALMSFKDAGEIQFLHDGKFIAFAEPIPARLTVEYQTLITDLRLKVVARRTLPQEQSVTPSVSKYILKARGFGIS